MAPKRPVRRRPGHSPRGRINNLDGFPAEEYAQSVGEAIYNVQINPFQEGGPMNKSMQFVSGRRLTLLFELLSVGRRPAWRGRVFNAPRRDHGRRQGGPDG